MSLPNIHGCQPSKIHEFYETLMYNVQSLETLGKLSEVNGYVRATIDKLEGIRGDLVRMDDDWQEWKFPHLVEALRKWTERNPVKNQSEKEKPPQLPYKRDKNFNTRQEEREARPPRSCVYCDAIDHRSVDCKKVERTVDRKKLLSSKQLCFNCARPNHKAVECKSRTACQKCKRRHHTSICDDRSDNPDEVSKVLMTAPNARNAMVTYPVVVVEVNVVKCRALLDTGAGSSYASSTLINHIRAKPIRKEFRRIEMMLGAVNKVISVYNLSISSVEGDFKLETEVTQVDRNELLTLKNPKYREILTKFKHLNNVKMQDADEKPELPVHLILGASEYAQIKTETKPKIGLPGEPIAELTKFGWTVLSPGKEINLTEMLLTQTASPDYEQLCRLDVLGLKDSATDDQEIVFEEFKEQLTKNPGGWYETSLPWKGNHPPLPTNKAGSLNRLDSLVRKLKKQNTLEQYDQIIQDQLQQGIVERVENDATNKEFYIPHKPVVRESAETTKMRIVYDGSARANPKAPSLNDCLETGPPLQNLLWDVLVRNRFHAVAVTGDLKQAFLQVRIRESDRDALRFHWLKDLQSKEVEVLRFTRALFGLAPSPFLLAGVIKEHLRSLKPKYPDLVDEIEKSLYVDDLISGSHSTKKALELKQTAKDVFSEAGFELHKWHSNVKEIEAAENPIVTGENQSYAKQQLGVSEGETKLLGLAWSKDEDSIQVNIPKETAACTKRGILGKMARIYDPLGLVSPLTLTGKTLFRDACDLRIAWDAFLPGTLQQKWLNYERNLPDHVSVPRSLAKPEEAIQSIELHAFGDASGIGVSAAVYATVHQQSGVNTGLVTAKSRLAKKGLTIPRLELVSGHMATNLVHNVKKSLQGFPVQRVVGWLDSAVALHWIRGNGEYKQFVGNRVRKIQEKSYIEWRHVTSADNPADLGSRGGDVSKSANLWWKGPDWLLDENNWPPNITTHDTSDTRAEIKAVKEIFAVAVAADDELDRLLEKHEYWKTIRITTRMNRFVSNARNSREDRITGPLTTEETARQVKFWIQRAQARNEQTGKFAEDQQQLNLQKNDEGTYECRGRIQGHYPVYLPDNEPLTEKIVMHAHKLSCHGGVGMTMAKFREKYWSPRLRSIVKRVTKACQTCKRFRAIAVPNPPTGNLPRDRTEGNTAFQVVGVDYAGPIKYLAKGKRERKAYVILYACSLTRAVYLELLPSQETTEFLRSFKRLIARRGRPQKIYSDNGKTFVAAAKWLKQIMKDERLHDWLAKFEIKWQFNTSRAPWWGGQFERIVGLMKQALYKAGGGTLLTWNELQDLLLDVEVALNNRPLSYVEDDVQLPILTPNSLMFNRPNQIPTQDYHDIEEVDLRKTAKRLERCKDMMWRRWTDEYLRGLRERHNLKHQNKKSSLKLGDVVIIKGDERNRNKWKLGIVENLIPGRDGVIRVAKLRAGKNTLERAVQHLYPLELSCDVTRAAQKKQELKVTANEFRPKRDAAAAAEVRMQDIAEEEDRQ